jgi:hypothetical protein
LPIRIPIGKRIVENILIEIRAVSPSGRVLSDPASEIRIIVTLAKVDQACGRIESFACVSIGNTGIETAAKGIGIIFLRDLHRGTIDEIADRALDIKNWKIGGRVFFNRRGPIEPRDLQFLAAALFAGADFFIAQIKKSIKALSKSKSESLARRRSPPQRRKKNAISQPVRSKSRSTIW